MPKDTKGHGSNKRSANEITKRLKLGLAHGGLSLGERYQATMDKRNKTGAFAAKLREGSGHKSDQVATHDAMGGFSRYGSSDARFAELGGSKDSHKGVSSGGTFPDTPMDMRGGKSVVPPDVAARFARERSASKGFKSGKREINRLKRKGK